MGTTKGYALLPDEARDLKDMLRDWRNQKQSNGGASGNSNAADQRQFNMKVRLTSAISGQGGRYNGKLITNGVSTSGTSGNLAATDLGALAASANVIVWNLSEAGLSTHDVNLSDDSQCVQLGMLLSYDRDSGKAIIGVVVPITRLTVTDCGDHEGTGRRAILGPGFTLTTTTLSGYVGTIDTNFKNNDNYLDIYVDDCAVAFDWMGFDSQWYTSGSSLNDPYLTTDTPDPRGTVRLVFDQARSGSTITDNSVSWDVSWSSANGGTLVVKGSVIPKLALCDLTDFACTSAVPYDHTVHSNMIAWNTSTSKWVKIAANELAVNTNVAWDGTNHKITQTQHTIYGAFEVGSGSTTDVVVFDPACP